MTDIYYIPFSAIWYIEYSF